MQTSRDQAGVGERRGGRATDSSWPWPGRPPNTVSEPRMSYPSLIALCRMKARNQCKRSTVSVRFVAGRRGMAFDFAPAWSRGAGRMRRTPPLAPGSTIC
eukprot:544431-Rhodomonas_salina.1